MPSVLILNGPNLNLLGSREPGHYGSLTLDAIITDAQELGPSLGLTVNQFQSNAEHELIERVQLTASDETDFIVLNPAGLTHTSVALRDALLGAATPFIEVHLSNVQAREPFRHHSYFTDIAQGCIAGLGPQGYRLALRAAARLLREEEP